MPSNNCRTEQNVRRIAVAVQTYAAYGQRIIDGICDYADRHRQWEFVPMRNPNRTYSGPEVDGVICESAGPEWLASLPASAAKVLVTSRESSLDLPTVLADNRAVGAMAADYFQSLGFGHLGYFGTGRSLYVRQRHEGLAARADQLGLDVQAFVTIDPAPAEAIYSWIRALPRPVGVLASEDAGAVALANHCRDLGVLVPEQVAILGVDDDSRLCRMSTPPLSSIDHGARRIGFEAARLLDDLLSGNTSPDGPIQVPPVKVVVRQSTDTLAIEDPNVARAVRFIRQRIADGIGPKDVIASMPVARRSLEAGFRRCLDRSIGQEITRLRIERVRKLLRETDLALPEICELTGYRYPSQLSAMFSKHVGISPSRFRRQGR
jgi:LacI family transcriptional regulator